MGPRCLWWRHLSRYRTTTTAKSNFGVAFNIEKITLYYQYDLNYTRMDIIIQMRLKYVYRLAVSFFPKLQ